MHVAAAMSALTEAFGGESSKKRPLAAAHLNLTTSLIPRCKPQPPKGPKKHLRIIGTGVQDNKSCGRSVFGRASVYYLDL